MKEIRVKLSKDEYSIFIERGLIEKVSSYIKEINMGNKIAIITDDNIENIYGHSLKDQLRDNGFIVKMIVIKAGEQSKSLSMLQYIYEELLSFEITRGDLILAFGGGVVGDVGGFAAATYLRGIPFVQIPTTLLAQIDSSVGGKVAVNLPVGKNLVGSFYQPKAVLIDPDILSSLDKRNMNNGMAEVIKYACIVDKNLFKKLMELSREELLAQIEDIIYTCCRIKTKIVEQDERDMGERMLLNFGHTLGHAIENYFNTEKYTHGEAVAMGMYNITKKSEALGITKKGTAEQLEKILKKYHLPYKIPTMDTNKIIRTIALDKKNKGDYIELILLRRIGVSERLKFTVEEIGRGRFFLFNSSDL